MQCSPRIVVFHRSPEIRRLIRQKFSFVSLHFPRLKKFSQKGIFHPLDIYVLSPRDNYPFLALNQFPDCIPYLQHSALVYSKKPISPEKKNALYNEGYLYIADSGDSIPVFYRKLSWLLGQKYQAISQKVIANRLNQEFTSLKEHIQDKNEMLHMAVHDLRSPLSAMVCYSELLMDGILDTMKERGVDPLHVILQNCQFLIDMVNDLLDLAKHDSGKKQLKFLRTNLTNIIKKVVRSLGGLASNKKITVKVLLKKIPDIFADTHKMERVIINLFANAIKFTKTNGTIWIRTFQKGNHVVFAIQDTGPGIKQSDIDKIFNKFNIGDDSSITGKGHGLGLAITKSFVEMHGGRVFVKSERHKGSTFIIHLPIEKRLEPESKPMEKRVAILDLGKDLDELKRLTGQRGLNADYFTSGNEVIEKVSQGSYACLLINERCNYESLGLKVFADILQGRLKNVSVLYLVPAQMSGEEIELYHHLDIHVIQKPLSMDKLFQLIGKELEKDRRKE